MHLARVCAFSTASRNARHRHSFHGFLYLRCSLISLLRHSFQFCVISTPPTRRCQPVSLSISTLVCGTRAHFLGIISNWSVSHIKSSNNSTGKLKQQKHTQNKAHENQQADIVKNEHKRYQQQKPHKTIPGSKSGRQRGTQSRISQQFENITYMTGCPSKIFIACCRSPVRVHAKTC